MADHVKRGDVARMAGRWADAAAAYGAALDAAERERWPREKRAPIAGELGLSELALERYVDAADHLEFAVFDNISILGSKQHLRFTQGLRKAERQVATLYLGVNPGDAEILIDGSPVKPAVRGRSGVLVIHLEPGHHTIRTRLPGHFDEETSMTLTRDSDATLAIRLHPKPSPIVAAPSTAPKTGSPIVVVAGRDPRDSATTKETLERSIGGVSLIPMISFGLAPSAAAGGALDVTWRWHRLSASADFRLFASETTDSDSAVRTLVGRAHVSACGYRGFFSLCGVLGLGRLHAIKDPTIKIIETQEPWSGSIGLRPSAEWQFSEHLVLRGFAELDAILGQPSVWVDGSKMWVAPPVAGILGIGLMVPLGNRGSDDSTKAAYSSDYHLY